MESGAGSEEDIARAREESHGLGLFVRSLVGLDREAATAAFDLKQCQMFWSHPEQAQLQGPGWIPHTRGLCTADRTVDVIRNFASYTISSPAVSTTYSDSTRSDMWQRS